MNKSSLIIPDWPAPANVKSLQTTRHGGISHAPYDSLNLGDHVEDNPLNVASNRQLLNPFVPSEPLWLKQVHGVVAIDAATAGCLPSADASYAKVSGAVCAVMTADCLPVLLCDEAGTMVAAVHAGWKGLLDGVIESTVKALNNTTPLMAWFGPAIGPNVFEVGSEVRAAFIGKDRQAEKAFVAKGDKWLGDMYLLARQRLNQVGVENVYGGGLCTFTDKERFFSYRRDGLTGRMATLIWLD